MEKFIYRYNFHKPHCAEALEVAGENVQKALEILFYKYFKVDPENKPNDAPSISELKEMRNDEKAVLESIYDTSFRVKDNNIWSVKLNLEYLTKMYEKHNVEAPKKKVNINYNNKTKPKEVCKLFLKGPCRFGAKCKFLHEVKLEEEIEKGVEETKKIQYELEVWFPENSLYPFEIPMLFFKTETSTNIIPELTFLRITTRLIDEAKILAQDGIPSIYSLVELLNNEEEIVNFIQFDTRTYPEPSECLFPQLVENGILTKEKLPSHYKKGENKDNRSNKNFEVILKDNKEIYHLWLEKKDNDRYNKMMIGRQNLPAWQKKNDILNALQKSQVSLFSSFYIYFFK